jgi:hypothetical protein
VVAVRLTEKEITRQIRQVLRVCRITHYKAWGGPMSEKGIPDIIGIMPGSGQFVGIEVKRPGGHVSSEQARWIRAINDAGGIGIVVYSVDDVIDQLGLDVKLNPLFAQTKN